MAEQEADHGRVPQQGGTVQRTEAGRVELVDRAAVRNQQLHWGRTAFVRRGDDDDSNSSGNSRRCRRNARMHIEDGAFKPFNDLQN